MPTTQPSQSDCLALQRAGLALLHPRGSRGKVVTARAAREGHGWDEGLVSPSSKAISAQLSSAEVEYVGMHRFSGRRHSARVTGISSGFLDLDYYKDGLPHADASAEDVASILIAALEAADVPLPSYVQDSGQGAYAVWLFQDMSGKALSRWQTAMRGLRGPDLDADGNLPVRRGSFDAKVEAFEARMLPLWRTLKDLGLDRGAIDPARVLRLMGATNHKTGRLSRLAWPSAIQDVQRGDFDAWCDSLMPLTRAELHQLRAEREAWKKANPDYVKVQRRPKAMSGSKWAMVFGDLMRLLDHRGATWFREHKRRDWWCLIAATALSQTTGGTAEEWADRLAHLVGLPVNEVKAALSGVERGMVAHAAGERREWKGEARPAFYDFSYATIIDRMMISADEARDAGLRVLVPGGATPLTAAERQKASRTARAVVRTPRETQAEERLYWGLDAREMRKLGATYADLSEAFGKSEDTIRRAIREVEAALSEGSSSCNDASELAGAVHTPDVLSHNIVGEAPTEPSSEAVEVRFTPAYSEYRTSTAAWAVYREADGRGGWIEQRWDLPLAVLPIAAHTPVKPRSAAQDALCLAVLGQVARGSATARRGLRRASARAAARPVALVPLDPEVEARLYREASGR